MAFNLDVTFLSLIAEPIHLKPNTDLKFNVFTVSNKLTGVFFCCFFKKNVLLFYHMEIILVRRKALNHKLLVANCGMCQLYEFFSSTISLKVWISHHSLIMTRLGDMVINEVIISSFHQNDQFWLYLFSLEMKRQRHLNKPQLKKKKIYYYVALNC